MTMMLMVMMTTRFDDDDDDDGDRVGNDNVLVIPKVSSRISKEVMEVFVLQKKSK